MFGLSDYPDAIIRGAALGLITLVWVILVVRVIGLRTFSKMTACRLRQPHVRLSALRPNFCHSERGACYP